MKNIILCFLLLSCLAGKAQNRLTDLYNLNAGDNYPTNMPNVKEWINLVLGKVFVRNLQFSDNTTSSSKFIMFNPVIGPATSWTLGVEGAKIIPNNSYIRATYDHDIYSYLRQFDITKFDYKPHSYFLIAKDVLRISDNEMLANTFNFFVEPSSQKNHYRTFIDIVNKKKNLKIAYLATEDISSLSKLLIEKYPKGISDLIYDCFIVKKTKEKTIENIERFYQITGFFLQGVEERVNNLINPKIAFRQDKPFLLEIPNQVLKLNDTPDSIARFSVETGTIVLNYKKRALEISLLGKLNGKANSGSLKLISYKNNKQRLSKLPSSAEPQIIKQLNVTIAEKTIKLTATSTDNDTYQLVDQQWKRQ